MTVRLVTEPQELRQFFADDARVHIYALGDLNEPFWSASTWWRQQDSVVGLVGLPDAEPVVYAVSTRDPDGTLKLLIDLVRTGSLNLNPTETLITGPLGLGQGLSTAAESLGWSLGWHRSYHRYWLPDHVELASEQPKAPQRPTKHNPTLKTIELSDQDQTRLAALYGYEPGAAFFHPSMLRDRTFVGVETSDGSLVAAAGTHVYTPLVGSLGRSPAAGAIGAVYVHPDYRGQGLGQAVTAGVAGILRRRNAIIGLNCADQNTPARRVYGQMGFQPLLNYEEALVVAQQNSVR